MWLKVTVSKVNITLSLPAHSPRYLNFQQVLYTFNNLQQNSGSILLIARCAGVANIAGIFSWIILDVCTLSRKRTTVTECNDLKSRHFTIL